MRVATTWEAVCVASQGHVWCAGTNHGAQLGRGLTSQPHKHQGPERVPGLEHVVELAAFGQRFCAIVEDGQVYCWGHNQFGEGGPLSGATCPEPNNEPSNCNPSPTLVPGVEQAAQLGLSEYDSCARLVSGKVVCWGREGDGMGSTDTATWFRTITDAKDLTLGTNGLFGHEPCVVHAPGGVECDPLSPVWASGQADVERISDGVSDPCLLSRSGQVRCGFNIIGRESAAMLELKRF
jgi:hypothetical protein